LGNQHFLPPCISTASCQQNFSAGEPIAISGHVDVFASDFNPQDPGEGSEEGQANVGFGSFSVLDSLGHPIIGFQYTSASGTNYSIAGGTFVTPEPATGTGVLPAVLIALSLAAVRGRLN
jgi:hypothetical protein